MSELDAVLAELQSLRQRLDALPEDAFDERAQLEARHHELQARAAEARAGRAPQQDEERLEGARERAEAQLEPPVTGETGRVESGIGPQADSLFIPEGSTNVDEEIVEAHRTRAQADADEIAEQRAAVDDEDA